MSDCDNFSYGAKIWLSIFCYNHGAQVRAVPLQINAGLKNARIAKII